MIPPLPAIRHTKFLFEPFCGLNSLTWPQFLSTCRLATSLALTGLKKSLWPPSDWRFLLVPWDRSRMRNRDAMLRRKYTRNLLRVHVSPCCSLPSQELSKVAVAMIRRRQSVQCSCYRRSSCLLHAISWLVYRAPSVPKARRDQAQSYNPSSYRYIHVSASPELEKGK